MNSKKLVATGLSALMASTMLAGCSSSTTTSTATTGGEDEKITTTITVWGPQEDQSEDNGNWLQTQCEKFAEEHPNWDITFEYGVCSEADAGSTVSQDAEAAADVYMFANDQIGTLIDANAISELGGSTLEAIKANNSEAVVNSVTFDGGVYGVPFTGNTWYMFYDTRVFSEDDVKNMDTMFEKGTVAIAIDNGWYLGSFYAANGATFFGEDGQDEDAGIVLGDGATAVTDWLIDAVDSKKLVNDKDGSGLAGLADGTVNAIFTGSWNYQNVVDALGEENVGICALPTITIDGEEKQMMSFAGSKAIGVNPNTEYPEVAVALAAYLGGTSSQQDHYDLRSVLPTDSNVDVAGDALAEAQSDTMDRTSILQPSFSGMGDWWTPAENMGASILNKEITHSNSEKATADLEELVNKTAVE